MARRLTCCVGPDGGYTGGSSSRAAFAGPESEANNDPPARATEMRPRIRPDILLRRQNQRRQGRRL